MENLNRTIRRAQGEVRGESSSAVVQPVEEACFDECDRIMRDAVASMERNNTLPDVELPVTQPKGTHEHQRNLGLPRG